MDFCPNCFNILDCMKSLSTASEKKILKKVIDLIKVIESNDNLDNYKLDFNKTELLENKKYIKFSDDIKNKINILFDMSYQTTTTAEYKCLNCGFNKPISETVKLYFDSIDNDNSLFIKSLEENELLCSDHLLPNTKDYICKNLNCITHKQINLKRAIFYKERNIFKANYICCVCFYNW